MHAPLTRRLDSPLATLSASALLITLFLAGMFYRYGSDVSRLIVAGDRWTSPEAGIYVLPSSDGYDGQFYYRLALDPFTAKRTDFGVTLDLPSYRQQRILFPLLACLLALGRTPLVPAALVAVNFLAMCALGWIGGALARDARQHAAWGVLLPLYPGFLLSIARDLPEPLEAALLAGSLLALRRRRHAAATVLLVLAVLTRETALVVAFGALAVFVYEKRRAVTQSPVRWHFFAVPLATAGLSQLVLYSVWGTVPLVSNQGAVGLPFEALLRFVAAAASFETRVQRLWIVEVALFAAFTLIVLRALKPAAPPLAERFSWWLAAVGAAALGRGVWVEDYAYMRALTELYLLGAVVLLGASSSARTAALIGAAALHAVLLRELVFFGY